MPQLSSLPRNLLRRYIWRLEAVAFLPLIMLGGVALGGQMVLIVAAAVFPLLFTLLGASFMREALGPRDRLTGLPLKPAVTEAIDRIFSKKSQSSKATIAFAITIDDYETVEARYGLTAAEDVLRKVGERITMALRGTDIVARIDTATFAAAFGPVVRADLETGLQVSARIQDAVRAPLLIDSGHVYVTCSVGFCLASRAPQPSGKATLGAALDALAEAQASGAGSIRSFSGRSLHRPATVAETAEEALEALENGQIRPWFQPQVSTDTGTITGFEALPRWEHPTRGILGPDDFLPSIAAAGQIERLGEVVLFHAFTALKSWDRAGLLVPAIGVNFCPEELRNPQLADKIAWELDRFDLTSDRLTVEILENVAADARDDSVTRSIGLLSEMGCRIDLDNFGTGHASLAALRRFKVGRIKIDRSFVLNVDEDREQQKMVAAIIGLAEQLGLGSLAEGIERVGEHSMLAQLGCGYVQGTCIARAMPFEDTISWIKRHDEKLSDPIEFTQKAV